MRKPALGILLLVLGFFIHAPATHAAAPVCGTFATFAVGDANTTQTGSVNVSGTDTELILFINQNGFDNVQTPTFNGASLTQAIKKQNSIGPSTAYIYYILNATGPGNQTLTVTESSNPNQIDIDYMICTGVSQSATPDVGFLQNQSTAAGGNFTATVNVSATNSLLASMQISTGSNPTSSVNATLRSANYAKNAVQNSSAGVGTGNQTIGYGWSAVANQTTIIAMAIAPPAPSPLGSILGLVRAFWIF